MKLEDVKISYSVNVNSSSVNSNCVKLLQTIGVKSDEKNIVITSVARTSSDQARIMYDNCVKLGVDSQLKLYGRNGDKVIHVFMKGKKKGLSRSVILDQMWKEILVLGPSKVSKHCADPKIFNVFDIPFTSISNHSKFKRALESFIPYPIYRFLDEKKNSCFHVEMKIADVQDYFKTIEYQKIIRELGLELV